MHITHWCDHLCIQLIIWIGKYLLFCSNHTRDLMQNSFFLKITPLEHNGKSSKIKRCEEKCCTLLLRPLFFSLEKCLHLPAERHNYFLVFTLCYLLTSSHRWLGSIIPNSRMPEELSIKQETTDTKIDVDHEVTMKHPLSGLSPANWGESVQDRRSQRMNSWWWFSHQWITTIKILVRLCWTPQCLPRSLWLNGMQK